MCGVSVPFALSLKKKNRKKKIPSILKSPQYSRYGSTMRAHKWESVLQVMELIIAIWATGQLPDSALPGGSTGRLVSDILGSL